LFVAKTAAPRHHNTATCQQVGALILYSVVSVPFRIGFRVEDSPASVISDIAIDSIFGVDILATFRTAYFDDELVSAFFYKPNGLKCDDSADACVALWVRLGGAVQVRWCTRLCLETSLE